MDIEKSVLKKRTLLIYGLPVLHFCACVVIAFSKLESGWEYMIYVDFPFSVLMVALLFRSIPPLISVGLFGSLWWYLLSRYAEILFSRYRQRRKRVGSDLS
jgi:pilus assembly protein TadC